MARTTVTMHRGHSLSRVAGACAHTDLSYPASILSTGEATPSWQANQFGNLNSQDKREPRVAIT